MLYILYIYVSFRNQCFPKPSLTKPKFSKLPAHVKLVRLREVVIPCAGETLKTVKVNPR